MSHDSDPLPYSIVDRSVKAKAALLASYLGFTSQHALGSLIEFWDLCGEPRELERLVQAGIFKVVLPNAEIVWRFHLASGKRIEPEAMVSLGLLEPQAEAHSRIRGMSRHFKPIIERMRVREAGSKGGKRSAEVRKEAHGTAQPRSGSASGVLPERFEDASKGASKHSRSSAEAEPEATPKLPEAADSGQRHSKLLGEPDRISLGGGSASSGGAGGKRKGAAAAAKKKAPGRKPKKPPVAIKLHPPPRTYPPRTHDELGLTAKPAPPPSPPVAHPAHVVPGAGELKRFVPSDGPEKLQALWGKLAGPGVPKWQGMPKKRREAAVAALQAWELATWPGLIERINRSDFLCGRRPGKRWRPPSVDWFLREETLLKLAEGSYDNDVPEQAAAEAGAACHRCEKLGGERWTVGDEGREHLLCQECLGAMVEQELPTPAAVSDWIECPPVPLPRKAVRA